MADAVLRKVAWRLVPFLGLGYFFAFLDRVNVGFAALTMNADIGLSAAAYGFGAGIFFIGYVLFEVPSNVILARVGARIWIARIMISWGLLSAAMALVEGPTSFYVLRFLLGVAEAGFFPGIIYFLSCWFPSAYRARILGAFMVAIPLSGVLGAPLSTQLLGLAGFGLAGWQWMFILEGLPAALLGLAVLKYLRDRPADAEWLEPHERELLDAELAREGPAAAHGPGVGRVLANPVVWLFGLAYFGIIVGFYGYNFWLPQMVKSLGALSNVEVGLLLMIPSALAGIVMVAWGSQRRAALARCAAGPARRGRARRQRDPAGPAGRGHRRADGRGHRRVLGAARVLDAAGREAHRPGGGGRHRARQLDRQRRGIRRAVADRPGEGGDGLVRARAVGPRRRHGGRGHHRARDDSAVNRDPDHAARR
jgi:MFS transporter, ACS family, tartrate transporter